MKRIRPLILAGIVVWIGFTLALQAQTASTSAITGTITDASGGVVAGATITATNTDNGQSRTVSTGADGTYNFGLLPPGTYKVIISATGFRQEEVTVTVAVTEAANLSRQLALGSQADTITVEAAAVELQTGTSAMGTVVDTSTVVALPLTTRNYIDILGLSAGANGSVPNAISLGRGGVDVAVNGATTFQNAYQMDGVSIVPFASSGSSAENAFFPSFGVPNPDTLQEFKIQTSLFDAGYGRNPGANVNVVTKSGTNTLHGSAFEFFRNTDLNSEDFFANLAGLTRPVLNQNQFGATLGGPIKKDKLFLFGSYQHTWQKNGAAAQGFSSGIILPPIPEGDRNAPGFQTALGAAFCPNNKSAAVESQYLTNPGLFGAGQGTQVACDGSNINPVAMKILQAQNANGTYYLPGSANGGFQQTAFTYPAYDIANEGLINGDYTLNSKNTLATRYYHSLQTQDLMFPAGGMVPGTLHSADVGYHNAILRLTSIVTPQIVNEAHASMQRTTNSTYANPTSQVDNSVVGMSPLGPANAYIPEITFVGLYTVGVNESYNTQLHNTVYQLGDQLSWTHEKHTMRFGGEIERGFWNQINRGQTGGTMTFQTFDDFLIGLPGGCGPAVPGACNGSQGSNVTSTAFATRVNGVSGAVHEPRIYNAFLFAQDDFKVTRDLTLNLGLRWEYDGITTEKYGTDTNVLQSLMLGVPIGTSAATGSYAGYIVPNNYPTSQYGLPAGIAQSGNSQIPILRGPPLDNFAPRFGFAWQPGGNEKTVIRGGAGYFYDRIYGQFLNRSYFNAPPVGTLLDTPAATNQFASLAEPWNSTPAGTFAARWINFATDTGSNLTTNMLNQQFFTPTTYQWNLTVQRQFRDHFVLEVAYVGSKGIHQPEIMHTVNVAQFASATNPIVGLTTVNGATVQNAVTTNTDANSRLRVPFLGYNPGGLQLSDEALDYRFNSLQVTLRRQFSSGLALQAAYTWSRSFTDFSTASGADSGDPNNLRQQWGLSTLYRPQRLVITYNYQIPTSSVKGLVKAVAGYWSVSGVTTIQDGLPFDITDSRGGAIFGLTTSRAQLANGATFAELPTSGSITQRLGGAAGGPGYLNAAAFTTIPLIGGNGTAGTGGTGWGDSGIAPILGPGQFNFNVSLVKAIPIRERLHLQFRTEFYNAFNHPQFNNPSANFAVPSTFGRISSTSVNPRLIQFALKLVF
jgi:Carboxypeptidase regulatory-like domain